MRLGKREIGPVEKKGFEEKDLRNEYPEVVSALKGQEIQLKKNIEVVKKLSPVIKKTIETLDKIVKESGFKGVLLAPEERGINMDVWPLGSVIFSPASVANYKQLEKLNPGLAKNGFRIFLDVSRENWEGDSWKKTKEQFKKLEEIRKLKEEVSIPAEIKNIREGVEKGLERLKKLAPSKEKNIQGMMAEFEKTMDLLLSKEKDKEVSDTENTQNKIKEITEEEMRLTKEIGVQSRRQYFEETKKNLGEKEVLENIAKMEAFSELIKSGLQAKTGKERWNEYSSAAYPFLEEGLREEIGKMVINIEKEVQNKKELEENSIIYA